MSGTKQPSLIRLRVSALPRYEIALASIALLVTSLSYGQDGQFEFDSNGNLQSQMPANLAAPQILAQPQPQVVGPDALASFFVVAANTHNLTYQWRFNGTNLNGATNDALLLQNVGATNEGQYSVVLTNISGSVTSAPAALLLDGDRDGLPDSWELASFGNLNQYPTGDADGDGVSNRDEFLDGTNPASSASVRYRLTVLSNGGLVEVTPSRLSYTNGEVVTLTATPFAPDFFRGWTGDTNTTSNPITLTMTTNKTVFAHQGPQNLIWNGGNGDWHVASNWEPNFVPTTNDNVSITSSATVTLNSAAECHNFTLGNANSAPTLTGSGTLTLHGASTWERGTMSGSGRTIIAPGGTLNLANPATVSLATRTLENGGAVLWTGVDIILSGAVITNRAGALFETWSGGGLEFNGGSSRFDNAGTFRKAVNTGTTTVFGGVAFNNYGTVEIQTGTLWLLGGGVNSGTIELSAGTTLNLGGAFSATGGSSITGAGNLTMSGGATLAGLVNVSGVNLFSSGTVNLNGNYICTNNTLNIAGGTANFNGTGVVTPAVVNLSGGTLGGNQVVTVLGQMSWTGGGMSGSGRTIIAAGVTLNFANPGNASSTTRTLENGGTVLWTGVGNLLLNNAVITNRAGALFETRGAGGFDYSAGSPRFDNAGTFRKAVNTGTTTVFGGVAFNNHGTVEIQTGTLWLTGGGANSGTIELPAGTTLNLGGAYTATGGSSITGAGNLTMSGGATLAGLVNVSGVNLFSGGTVNLNGNYICTNNTLNIAGGTANFNGTGVVTPAVVNLSGGTLGGNQVVTVLGQMSWTGGGMSGSGRTIIPAGVTLNFANPGNASLTTRTLENGGTVLWTGVGNLLLNNAVITNRAGALFETRGAGEFDYSAGSPRFDNAGTFRKSVNPGTTTVASLVNFNNYNTVEIRSGILALNGGYVSTANALLHCAIGGATVGTGYGRLQVAGTVTLNGALRVDFANGFLPAVNDSFIVLAAGTRNGTFANFYYPSNEVTMQLSNTANSVILSVSQVLVVPQPILLPPEISGPDLRLRWTAVSNTTYRLEFNPDLSPSNWNVLPGDVTGLSNTATKLDLLTPSNRFYRVRVIP